MPESQEVKKTAKNTYIQYRDSHSKEDREYIRRAWDRRSSRIEKMRKAMASSEAPRLAGPSTA